MQLLVTRPARQAQATARRLRALGHDVVTAPLLEAAPLSWRAPAGPFDALIATSANAFLTPPPAELLAIPLHAVGGATAAAARRAGMRRVVEGPGDGAGPLYRVMADAGIRRALHLAGNRVKDAVIPPALAVERVTVYETAPVPLTPAAADLLTAGRADRVLLYSAGAARQFAAECARLGIDRKLQKLALLGPVPADFSAGWGALFPAERPTETALFAAAGILCE